jgi:hypothetical protein
MHVETTAVMITPTCNDHVHYTNEEPQGDVGQDASQHSIGNTAAASVAASASISSHASAQ